MMSLVLNNNSIHCYILRSTKDSDTCINEVDQSGPVFCSCSSETVTANWKPTVQGSDYSTSFLPNWNGHALISKKSHRSSDRGTVGDGVS